MLKLIDFGDVPVVGKHDGNFAQIKTASGKDTEGNEFNDLIVEAELTTTNSKEQIARIETFLPVAVAAPSNGI